MEIRFFPVLVRTMNCIMKLYVSIKYSIIYTLFVSINYVPTLYCFLSLEMAFIVNYRPFSMFTFVPKIATGDGSQKYCFYNFITLFQF